METRRVDTLEYLASPLISAPHGFSTRLGGVSVGIFESLNLGCRRGDEEAALRENYRRFTAATGTNPAKLVMANQVHGATVRHVTQADVKPDLLSPTPFEADGLVTDIPGITLVVFSADCVPILFHDPVRGVVAACHAGWRGTAAQIAAQTVKTMGEYGCRPENIRAAIGPAIGKCCFETDADVPQAMTAALGELAHPYITQTPPKYHLDLKELNRAILLRSGLPEAHLDVTDECTCCHRSRYWSHRYTGGKRGSQAAVIMLKEDTK